MPSEVPATARGRHRSPWTGPEFLLGATAVDMLSRELTIVEDPATSAQGPRPREGTSLISLDLSEVFGSVGSSSSKLQKREGWGTQDASSSLSRGPGWGGDSDPPTGLEQRPTSHHRILLQSPACYPCLPPAARRGGICWNCPGQSVQPVCLSSFGYQWEN